ncbi:MAG TPA: nucleotidyl transferase AbiEii/AbiGii toxin family protein, partial [archaeon]|nr:nucleotidyl transferase AbiEii/AbiGii toxin family protein [archaeon]
MIEKEMLNWLSDKLKIQNIALIEKDLLLQGLLNELSKSEYFSENFVFKGGTCLTKAYFGYYRFSEDLDFTWISQKNFENKTEKQIRKILSQ